MFETIVHIDKPFRRYNMVRITKVHTGGGDGGETSLVDGSRVGKEHPESQSTEQLTKRIQQLVSSVRR